MLKKLTLMALILCVALMAGPGKVLATPAIAPGGIGDLNLFGLYDVRPVNDRTPGWQNFIVIENTSNQWTAVHLRFRGWKKSIEVYDHIILLSPYDVFWAAIELATGPGQTTDQTPLSYTAGEVLIWSQDYQTLYNSGLTYLPSATFNEWRTKFQPDLLADCGFITDPDNLTDADKREIQAGYVEIVGLWQLENPYAPNDDKHVLSEVVGEVYPDGAINVYDVMNALYYEYTALPTAANPTGTYGDGWWLPAPIVQINAIEDGTVANVRNGLDCGNVIASAMSMGDTSNARFQLANFVAVTDFRLDTTDVTGHRDGYLGGAMVYPVDTLFWSWDALDNGRIPYYLNSDWATTIGAGFRDGDDIIGTPQANGGCGAWALDGVNNTWSLDDLETALANNEIWYQYYNGAFLQNYTTDVVVTFFTKHLHYFFADWPYWAAPANLPSGYAIALATQVDYWRALYDYRGDRGASMAPTGTANRSVEALACNAVANNIQEHFASALYYNGKITAYTYVWDMDQNKPVSTPDYTPPPGSPWHPVAPPGTRWIPHEVNIIRVGAPTPATTGNITDATGMLTNAAPDNYVMGQFSLTGIALQNGQRELGPIYGAGAPYFLPSIGVTIFDLNYSGPLYRSVMEGWHYRLVDNR